MNVTAHPAKMEQPATIWKISTPALASQDTLVLTVNQVSTYNASAYEPFLRLTENVKSDIFKKTLSQMMNVCGALIN